ncbi:tRNA(Met) cytidine acetyltransferase TmcA [Halobellus rarus]|uniref:tRNA(Met) cytidine acetyltransferase TmcA n=1 Tax=Halobellus rarus TaxID=1126237 RepID=A0ABD6CMV5_9EURY|nr:tRNA(Met) cytidine acetyltransferase TmcA [Halobellus rarus]
MNVAALAADLRAAARRADHRRLLVLAGERDAGVDAAFDAVEGAGIPDDETTIVTAAEGFRFERVDPTHARELLGTTRTAVIYDAHEDFSPNALGRLVGTVDGGGLFVLLVPPLDDWPDRPGSFESSLAVPPHGVDDVGGRFRKRLVETLRDHPGVAIVDLDAGTVERRGETDASAPVRSTPSTPPAGTRRFPAAAYEACLTADQSRALHSLEALGDGSGGTDADRRDTEGEADEERRRAVVVEADRGRGKSSAAGLAAGSLAAAGRDVLVTAPDRRNASDLFARARELLSALDALDGERAGQTAAAAGGDTLRTRSGGRIRFASPAAAADLPEDPDVVLVDEAAALPVRLLSSFLDAPAIAFFTTVHGYEGAGRGFSVRFRGELADSGHDVSEVTLSEPIRFAPADPVESWAFRALLLDARPPVDALVADASPSSVTYRALSPDELAGDEHLLREVFGLLVLAHYRTEPDDLARLLDAPNLRVRVLEHAGHVVSVALLAREGGLDAETRRSMYEGARVRGNMLPDVFTSQLRDEEAGVPVGYRVVRIATHHAARSRGLGSALLSEVRAEFDGEADYLGVGYGATPELLSFWESNGYETVHVSTTRNESSGEYSALMLDPLSETGRALCDRHARWFRDRVGDLLGEHLRDADPDVVRGALSACETPVSLDLSDYEWRVVVGVALGPGQYATAPQAFRRLALAALVGAGGERGDSVAAGTDSVTEIRLTDREERLLVRKVLQTHPADAVADELGYESPRQCLRALGDAYGSLVDRYGAGNEVVEAERERFDG